MKKFSLKLFIFLSIAVLIDLSLGKMFNSILERTNVTDFGCDNYICNVGEEELLVFGSSRAVHHYNTDMLRDSLQMSSYNCGVDGQGIILNYGRLLMSLERRQPKVIIYDIMPSFDLYIDDNYRYMKWLRPHFDREGIADIIESVDSNEPYKLYSHLYRYNSEYIYLLVSLLHLNDTMEGTGYAPLYSGMEDIKLNENEEEPITDVDTLKLMYLNQFIDLLDNCKLIFVVSPTWYGMKEEYLQLVKTICADKKIPFYDFSNNPKYVHNNHYFKDGMHLNSIGADEFTKDLIMCLKASKVIGD